MLRRVLLAHGRARGPGIDLDADAVAEARQRADAVRSVGPLVLQGGGAATVAAHQPTYTRLGRERRGDVELLCRRCRCMVDAWRHRPAPATHSPELVLRVAQPSASTTISTWNVSAACQPRVVRY
jgi:hypothetical protein